MSDLTSKRALIEEVQKYFVNNSIHKNDLAEVIAKLPTVEAKPVEWISCSKRLPDGCFDAEIEVIVSIHEPYSETVIDDSGFALYYPGTNKFHSVYGDRLDITEYVIAWQPLPEPYNAERGGKNESR